MKAITPPSSLNFFDKIQLASMRLFAKGARILGFKVTHAMASAFGLLVWHLSKKRQRLAINNVQKHLNVNIERATQIAKASFSENFCSFSEVLLTQNFGWEDLGTRFMMVNQENFEKFNTCDRPIVAITGHLGSWELLSSTLGKMISEDRPRAVVTRKYPNPAMQQFITEQREVNGATVIGHRSAIMAILRALRKKGLVAFLVDHKPKRSESMTLSFLGEETAVNLGPALLAVRAEAVIWPVFLNREKNGIYSYNIYDPLDTKDLEGTNSEKVAAATLFYTQAVETHIKKYPEQWFWMHNRWKKKRHKCNKKKSNEPSLAERGA